MKTKSYSELIRAALHHSINKVASDLSVCAKTPSKDFFRKRKLPLKTTLLMLVGIGGSSLAKEPYDSSVNVKKCSTTYKRWLNTFCLTKWH